MKKNNIFFGATAFALAIAGAFASKASTKVVSIVGYTAACVKNTLTECTLTGTNAKCQDQAFPGLPGTQTLYSRGIDPVTHQFACANQLITTN